MLKRTHCTAELKKVIGKEVVVSGWVFDVRLMGGINFILLRDKDGIIQITAPRKKVSREILNIYNKLHQEDVISVKGKVVRSKIAKSGIEIIPSEIEVISKASVPLPLDPREVTPANLDTRLNWRFMFFRTEEAKAIFRIQTEIIKAFRDFFTERGYIEMQPPIIISSASEGGAELFILPYFDKQAYLAQSPQLYKQMGAISFEKVFMILPVFRAEKFDQPTHLNEIRQMDIEQAFATDEDVMKVLEECFVRILKHVKEKCEEELKILGRDLKIPKLPLKRVKYAEAIDSLKKNKEKIEWGEDFTRVQEKSLAKLFGEAIFITHWPTALKPFYAMPYEKNPKICKAFDLIYNGLELASGTQRIHIPELLIKQLKEKRLNPDDFKYYIDCFRYGSPYHSGWSIGLERITMAITGKSNIREVTMFPRDRSRIMP
ncbi:MAG: aspartate--tRNA(Asn) ligase [Candidatus Aenigmarchaeota archaeon]|nr:aspartate--tRNA(Asn) ligase [Candidatus Aenigmarchaeota archaeon]